MRGMARGLVRAKVRARVRASLRMRGRVRRKPPPPRRGDSIAVSIGRTECRPTW